MKILPTETPAKRLTVATLSLWLVFVFASLGFGSEGIVNPENEILESAIIKDKGDYGVLIDGRQYQLDESTLIFDLMGKEIPLCDLPIPCKAFVAYRIEQNLQPVLLRIEVKQLMENSREKD